MDVGGKKWYTYIHASASVSLINTSDSGTTRTEVSCPRTLNICSPDVTRDTSQLVKGRLKAYACENAEYVFTKLRVDHFDTSLWI